MVIFPVWCYHVEIAPTLSDATADSFFEGWSRACGVAGWVSVSVPSASMTNAAESAVGHVSSSVRALISVDCIPEAEYLVESNGIFFPSCPVLSLYR